MPPATAPTGFRSLSYTDLSVIHREEIFEIIGNHPQPATAERKSMELSKAGSWEENTQLVGREKSYR